MLSVSLRRIITLAFPQAGPSAKTGSHNSVPATGSSTQPVIRQILCFAFLVLITNTLTCWGQATGLPVSGNSQTQQIDSDVGSQDQVPDQQTKQGKPAEQNTNTSWRLELGGAVATLNNGYGTWYEGDLKLTYTGAKLFTPTLSAASQTRPSGSQQTYGIGSYIHFGKNDYAIVSYSFAPNRGTILFPDHRYDVTAVTKIPRVRRLFVTTGCSFYRMAGTTSKIGSLGAIYYYRRLILNGTLSFEWRDPGSLPSKSGQFSIMTGRQGHYWLTVGANGGNINYPLLGIVPVNVQYTNYGFSLIFQKWIQKHWGVTSRYYYTNLMTAYQVHSVWTSIFYEF